MTSVTEKHRMPSVAETLRISLIQCLTDLIRASFHPEALRAVRFQTSAEDMALEAEEDFTWEVDMAEEGRKSPHTTRATHKE